MIRKLLDTLENAIDFVEIILLTAIVMAIVGQIVSRALFNTPLKFSEELSVFMGIAVVFLGGSVIERHDAHIKVTFLLDKVSQKTRRNLVLIGKILMLSLVIAIINGEKELMPRIMNLTSKAAGIPYIWIHSIILIACVLWVVLIVYTSIQLIRGE